MPLSLYLLVERKTGFKGKCEKPIRFNFIKTQRTHERSEIAKAISKVCASEYRLRQVHNANPKALNYTLLLHYTEVA